MPLRYSETLRRIFKEILHMQRLGLLDAAEDDKLREYLHTHRKAIHELQRNEDKAIKRPVPSLTPGQKAFHGGLTDAIATAEGRVAQ